MNPYNQLVVWPAVTLGDKTHQDFEDFFKEEGFRIKFADQFMTLPDPGEDPSESGGRSDILFYIHQNDIPKFAVWRLQHGMRWWEDYLDNGGKKIVPRQILDDFAYTWTVEQPLTEYKGG